MSAKRYDTLIEAAELAERLGEPDLAVIDCRWDLARPQWGAAAYAEAHIPGALFADMNHELAGPVTPQSGRHPLPDVEQLTATFSRWGIDDDVQVVAYDQNNGAAAARLWWLLRWLGHARVAVLNGGFAAWRAAGLPVTPEPAAREPRRFVARPDRAALVTTDEVVAALGTPDRILVDARSAERFAGRNETVDPVAGHVPGAVNHPFTRNLDASGRFLPPDELRLRWNETLSSRPGEGAAQHSAPTRAIAPENVVAMCGSGITACHNLLALEAAGLPGARLYAGSWSEWIRDPARPVAKG